MTQLFLSFPSTGGFTLSALGVQGPPGSGGGGGVTDGDKGDITVSGTGTTWTIDAGSVSLSKMADLATSTILGRATAGTGVPEALTPAQVRTLLNVADGANNYSHPNHTGDVTSVGDGATTIATGAVTLAKMANLAANSIIGNNTGSAATPIALTAAQVRALINVADGATANQSDAFLLSRTNHTGTQAASTITGLAAVATSGSASDLTAGTLPAARFDDTAHGSRAGGTLHANATTSVAGFMSSADKTKLDAITGTNTGDQTITLTSDVTGSGTGSFATTIANNAVTNAKAADMAANTIKANATASTADPADLAVGTNAVVGRVAGNIVAAQLVTAQIADDAVVNGKLANVNTATIKGRVSAGIGDPEDLTGTQATTLLDVFTTSLKGLAPASGGGTTNFLRADGTWAAPPGGGGGGSGDVVGPASATDNALARFDSTTGKLIQNSSVTLDDNGAMTFPAIAVPATPATDTMALFARKLGGRVFPSFIGPSGIDSTLQPHMAGNRVLVVTPTSGTTAPAVLGGNIGTAGTLSFQQSFTSSNRWLNTARKRTTTTTTAGNAASIRQAYANWMRGNAAGFGGFYFRAQFGVNINLNGSQLFVGLCPATGALGGNPSTDFPLNMCGMGWDSGDASTGNWQFFRNDGAGVPVKVDLGATNAARAVDVGYELIMFMAPNGSELFVQITNLNTGADVLTTSYTTDIPAANAGLCLKCDVRNGAVAAAANIEFAKIYIEADY